MSGRELEIERVPKSSRESVPAGAAPSPPPLEPTDAGGAVPAVAGPGGLWPRRWRTEAGSICRAAPLGRGGWAHGVGKAGAEGRIRNNVCVRARALLRERIWRAP